MRSNRFNLDEWRSGDSELQIIPVPPKIDFGLDATVAELTYDKLKMTNARGRLRVKDQRVTLENFTMNTLGGEIGVTGFYETTDPTKPTFDVGLKLTKLDIPSAFNAFTTVQMLAPVAKYASGTVVHRPPRERRARQEHAAALSGPDREGTLADVAGRRSRTSRRSRRCWTSRSFSFSTTRPCRR